MSKNRTHFELQAYAGLDDVSHLVRQVYEYGGAAQIKQFENNLIDVFPHMKVINTPSMIGRSKLDFILENFDKFTQEEFEEFLRIKQS